MDWAARGFSWQDGARRVRFGRGAAAEAIERIATAGLQPFALLATGRASATLPQVAAEAALVITVPPGQVPEAGLAAEAQYLGAERLPGALVALGGGRVIDACKAVAAAHRLPWAAIPTTLSGAEMSAFHRPLADGRGAAPCPAGLVIADPALSASQPLPALTASAMNAFGHAMEALYVAGATPATSLAAVEAARLLARGLRAVQTADNPAARDELALGALLAGWAIGVTGLGLHHVLCQTLVREAGAPHAVAYAVMAPHLLEHMTGAAPEELAPLVRALGGGDGEAAVQLIAGLAAGCGVTRLSQIGVDEAALPQVAAAVMRRAELRSMPQEVDEGGVLALLRAAL
jgi:maleylacetate reductase